MASPATAVATRPEACWLAVVAALAMLGAAWAMGTLLARAVRLSITPGAPVVALGLGLGALSHLGLALGVAGAYRRDLAWLVAGAGLLAGLAMLPRLPGALRRGAATLHALPPYERALTGLLGALAACVLVGALTPPFAIDVLRHHLNVARLFVAEGGVVFPPIVLYGHPLGGEMFYVWGLLLSGPLAGKLALAAHVLATAGAAGLLAGRHGGATGALHGALLTLATTSVWYFAIEGKIDAALLLHVALALLCLDVWWSDADARALVGAAVFLGFAASAKLLGLYAIVAALAVLWAGALFGAARRGARARWATLAGFVALWAVVAAPWYARTWWATGDPLWPMLHPWLGGIEGSGAAYRDALARLQARVSVGLDARGFVGGLGALLAGAPVLFGRALGGPLVIAGLPLLALDRNALRRAAPLAVFALAYYCVWFPLDQQGRYLLPALLALGPAAAVGLGLGRRSTAGRFVGAAVLAWGAASAGLALWTVLHFAPAITGREPLDDFLARHTSFHAEIREMNARLPRDAVVASDYAGLFYLDRPSIWLEDFQAFVDYDRIEGAEAMREALRRWKVSHLFLTGSADDARAAGDRPAMLAHALADRCGSVVYRNASARLMTSVTLDTHEAQPAVIVQLFDRCRRG